MSVLDDATIIYVPGVYKTSAVALQKPISAGSVSSLTFARASTGTRVNSAGLIESVATNIPRIDFLNDTCGSQLLEPARTNLLTYSEQFDNVTWIKANTTISADIEIAPDNTTTGDKLVSDVTTSSTHLVQSALVGGAGTYTFSVFAKSAGYDFIELVCNNPASGQFFDLANGTVLGSSGTAPTNATITEYANGWYRCTITQTLTLISRINIYISENGTSRTFNGDGTSGVFLWGAQIEAGSYPTSYIKTEASTVTRAAETLSKTGLAPELGDSEGTMYFEGSFSDVNSFVGLSDGTSNNRVTLGLNAGSNLSGSIITAGVIEGAITISGNTGQNYKIAIAYEVNRLVFYVGGVKIGEDNTVNTYAPGTLTRLGFDDRGSNPLYGKVSALHVWDTALTDTQLAELTS